MKIAGYLKTSLLDWPGKISSVVWTVGCNFRCPFCHNKNLIDLKLKKLENFETDLIISDLLKRKKWIDGVVITGGEPTIQKDLSDFCKHIKDAGFLVKIDSNGTNPEVLKKLIDKKLVDFIAMDIKNNFDEYSETVRVKIDILKVKKSMELILKSGLEYEFRTTIVPMIHNEESLKKMAMDIKKIADGINYDVKNIVLFLQNFQPKNCLDSSFDKVRIFRKKEINDFKKGIKKILPGVKIR